MSIMTRIIAPHSANSCFAVHFHACPASTIWRTLPSSHSPENAFTMITLCLLWLLTIKMSLFRVDAVHPYDLPDG
ncbi:MAG: hypothetical protein MUO76_14860 [Anaerolineaceae bacterium]|nr:hypothetical protein [Anaerolineaceae bacterium]